MAKKALHTIYPGLSKQLEFIDESNCRLNGGTLTNNPTFSNGIASFIAGSSQKITYPIETGVQSIRIKLEDITSFYMKLSSTRSIQLSGDTVSVTGFTSETIYVDGVAGTSVGTKADIVIVDTVQYDCDDIQVGYDGSTYGTFGIDLGQFFIRDLTASEVHNLYHNLQNVELQVDDVLIDFDSTRGTANLGDLTNSSTLTNITYKKIGKNYSALWNGTDSKIDLGSDVIGTKAVTIMGWIKASDWGEGAGQGRIISNDEFYLYTRNTGNRLTLTSNNSNLSVTSNNSIQLNKWQFIFITRTSAGVVNFYIGSQTEPLVLSGSADQDSGTPISGTTNVIIGNNAAQTRTFDGLQPRLVVVENILPLEQGQQFLTETLSSIK